MTLSHEDYKKFQYWVFSYMALYFQNKNLAFYNLLKIITDCFHLQYSYLEIIFNQILNLTDRLFLDQTF
jgi:hypothetical protein